MNARAQLGENDNVLLILDQDGSTSLTPARVENLAPLLLRVMGTVGVPWSLGSPVTIVVVRGTHVFRCDGVVESVEERRAASYLQVSARSWKTIDRRRAARLTVCMPVEIAWVEEFENHPEFARFAGEAQDLSETGMSVKSGAQLEEGWLVHLRAILPNGEVIAALAEIARIYTDADGATIAAFDFVDMSADSKRALSTFLEHAGALTLHRDR